MSVTTRSTPPNPPPPGSQSTPNWDPGYTPPSTEWNAWWAGKADAGSTEGGPFLPLTGGTMTGGIIMPPAFPTNPNAVITKAYADALTPAAGPFVPLSGGTMLGILTLASDPVGIMDAVTKQYADAINTLANNALTTANMMVPKTGGAMTGQLLLSGDPTLPLGAATKQYADRMVPLTGGTMTGQLNTASGVNIVGGGNLYVAGTFCISSINGYEWTFGENSGGDKFQNFRAGWYQSWSGSTGAWSWNSPAGNLMELDGSGNLFIKGNFNGGNAITFPGSSNFGSLTLSGGWEFFNNGSAFVQQFISGWYTSWAQSGGTWSWVGNNVVLMSLDGGGNLNTHGNVGVGASLSVTSNLSAGGTFAAAGFQTNNARVQCLATSIDGSITIWDRTANVAGGMLLMSSPYTQLAFGSADGIGNLTNTWMFIRSDGTFNISGQAFKPGGGTWADSSDARIKHEIVNYNRGLSAVRALQPRRFRYRGNDGERHLGVTDREFVGLVAQETEIHVPEMIWRTEGEIDGQEVDDLRMFDATALPYILINAIKELAERIAILEEVVR